MDRKKLKAKLDRAVKSLNEITEEVQKEYPEACMYVSGNGIFVCENRNTEMQHVDDIVLFDSIAWDNMDCGGW